MTAFPSYSTGTIAIAANATSVVGTGSNWTGVNAMPGDTLAVAGFGPVEISDVTDATHLVIDAWPYAAVTAGTAYSIKKDSPLRFVGAQSAVQVDQLVSALAVNGFYVFVPPDASVPDPSLGQDSQYAFQATTGKLWQKTSGTWNFIGTFKGFSIKGAWSSATAYLPFDVVSVAGSSYICILANTNETPPNATYWTVLASVGATGPASLAPVASWVTATAYVTGPPASYVSINGSSYECLTSHTSGTFATDLAAGKWGLITQAAPTYGGSSATSFAIGTGSKAFTTTAGLAYQVGNYVRAASAAGGANFMEGAVTAYSGTTLTINVTKTGGSGTHTDWNFSVSGVPGAGDMLSTNNLSDLTSPATARGNLGVDVATQSKSADYTVIASDYGSLLLLSGAHTLSFTAAATLGDKFKTRVRNTNSLTGLWTLDPNSTETIDGKTTLTLGIGEEMDIYCDGTAFYTNASRGKLVELWRQTASASATIDFDFAGGFPADFDEFEIHCVNVLAATNDTFTVFRVKTTASLTVQTTGYLYSGRYQSIGSGADSSNSLDSVASVIPLARPIAGSGMGNSTGYVMNGVARLISPQSSTFQAIQCRSSYLRSDGAAYSDYSVSGSWVSTAAPITGVRLSQSGPSNFASGTFVLYGIRK